MPGLRLILASQSARRAHLLRKAGYRFEHVRPRFADTGKPQRQHGVEATTLTVQLARKKARSILQIKDLCYFRHTVIPPVAPAAWAESR